MTVDDIPQPMIDKSEDLYVQGHEDTLALAEKMKSDEYFLNYPHLFTDIVNMLMESDTAPAH